MGRSASVTGRAGHAFGGRDRRQMKRRETVDTELSFESADLYPRMSPEQRKFKLRQWQPEWVEGGKKPSQIAILINGFLEGVDAGSAKEGLAFERYNKIAEALNRENIAAVFLPLPFHFDRCGAAEADGTFQAIAQLRKNGTYLYYGGYDQVKDDIKKLVGEIHSAPGRFGLDGKPQVHLIGYSLGGAAALGAAAGLGQEIASLSVLFSSWNLASIKPEAIDKAFRGKFKFGAQEWGDTLKALEDSRERFDPVFQDLMWGGGTSEWFENGPKRMLFVHGLDDELFPKEMTTRGILDLYEKFLQLDDRARKERECVFISVGGLDHMHVKAFVKRYPVAEYVASFIANPARCPA
jgi:pimeloyl-ACP methyl ester carboxylesterase